MKPQLGLYTDSPNFKTVMPLIDRRNKNKEINVKFDQLHKYGQIKPPNPCLDDKFVCTYNMISSPIKIQKYKID